MFFGETFFGGSNFLTRHFGETYFGDIRGTLTFSLQLAYLGANNDDVSNHGLIDGAPLLLVPGLDEVCPAHHGNAADHDGHAGPAKPLQALLQEDDGEQADENHD